MPLGLIARDSIQDLKTLGQEQKYKSKFAHNASKVDGEEVEASINTDGEEQQQLHVEDVLKSQNGNPQQARDDAEQEAASSPASKQTTASAASPGSTVGMYSGFTMDYADYRQQYGSNNTNDPYASYLYGDYHAEPVHFAQSSHRKENTNCWACIFPWLAANKPNEVFQEQQQTTTDEQQQQPTGTTTDSAAPSPRPQADDEISTNSDVLGEKLTQKERQAVLARLGLAQPEEKVNGGGGGGDNHHSTLNDDEQQQHHLPSEDPLAAASNQKGLLNGLNGDRRRIAGILKKRTSAANVNMIQKNQCRPGALAAKRPDGADGGDGGPRRRSLFPSYDTTSARSAAAADRRPPRSKLRASFAPMARVVTVKSKNDMTPEEKGDVWWQKSDYEDFRKTGRIIAKAMLEGGGEIWLARSASSACDMEDSDEDEKDKNCSDDKKNGKSAIGSPKTSGGDNACEKQAAMDTGNKWWHRFGHSRRGLEHVVSFDEGRQRQLNVRTAIHAVLEEQDRQIMYNRRDAEKLRCVSLNNTSWARDLALASGASDADAVQSAFAEDRKSREFYLLKIAKASPSAAVIGVAGSSSAATSGRLVPEFMQPALRAGASLAAKLASPISGGNAKVPVRVAATKVHPLDANTAAQIRFRRDLTKQQQAKAQQQSSAAAPADGGGGGDEQQHPIRDPKPQASKGDSMAQRAKGFISEDAEKMDMAAVLSGMGGVVTTTTTTSYGGAPYV